jgi:hypothetical protein
MLLSITVASVLLITPIAAQRREFHGLTGFGGTYYELPCATACHEALEQIPLECTPKASKDHGGEKHAHGRQESRTPKGCFANDPSYLTSLAWCIGQHCPNVDLWEIEKFWQHHAVSRKQYPAPPIPKWTYQESLHKINTPPTQEAKRNTVLNKTRLVNSRQYMLAWNQVNGREHTEVVHSTAA